MIPTVIKLKAKWTEKFLVPALIYYLWMPPATPNPSVAKKLTFSPFTHVELQRISFQLYDVFYGYIYFRVWSCLSSGFPSLFHARFCHTSGSCISFSLRFCRACSEGLAGYFLCGLLLEWEGSWFLFVAFRVSREGYCFSFVLICFPGKFLLGLI